MDRAKGINSNKNIVCTKEFLVTVFLLFALYGANAEYQVFWSMRSTFFFRTNYNKRQEQEILLYEIISWNYLILRIIATLIVSRFLLVTRNYFVQTIFLLRFTFARSIRFSGFCVQNNLWNNTVWKNNETLKLYDNNVMIAEHTHTRIRCIASVVVLYGVVGVCIGFTGFQVWGDVATFEFYDFI